MRFTVGGESFDLTSEQIIRAMKGKAAEPIQKYSVDVDGQRFPPKQVFATATGRSRQSFTTHEAQRVLERLGFSSRRGVVGEAARATTPAPVDDRAIDERLRALEARVEAIIAALSGVRLELKPIDGLA